MSDLLAPEYGRDSLRWRLELFAFVNLWVAGHHLLAGRHLETDLALAGDPH